MSRRATYLLQSDLLALRDWGIQVRQLFRGRMPYLVGSSIHQVNYRDVDVRVMLGNDEWDALSGFMLPMRLNQAVSTWGQKLTGLPIDFQVQNRDEANEDFDGPRQPIGVGVDS